MTREIRSVTRRAADADLMHALACRSFLSGDSMVMGHRGGTFAAAYERRGAAAALEMAVARLKTLEWRIGFIRRGVREPEGYDTLVQ